MFLKYFEIKNPEKSGSYYDDNNMKQQYMLLNIININNIDCIAGNDEELVDKFQKYVLNHYHNTNIDIEKIMNTFLGLEYKEVIEKMIKKGEIKLQKENNFFIYKYEEVHIQIKIETNNNLSELSEIGKVANKILANIS